MVSAQVMRVQARAGMGEGTSGGSWRLQEPSLLLPNLWASRAHPAGTPSGAPEPAPRAVAPPGGLCC